MHWLIGNFTKWTLLHYSLDPLTFLQTVIKAPLVKSIPTQWNCSLHIYPFYLSLFQTLFTFAYTFYFHLKQVSNVLTPWSEYLRFSNSISTTQAPISTLGSLIIHCSCFYSLLRLIGEFNKQLSTLSCHSLLVYILNALATTQFQSQ